MPYSDYEQIAPGTSSLLDLLNAKVSMHVQENTRVGHTPGSSRAFNVNLELNVELTWWYLPTSQDHEQQQWTKSRTEVTDFEDLYQGGWLKNVRGRPWKGCRDSTICSRKWLHRTRGRLKYTWQRLPMHGPSKPGTSAMGGKFENQMKRKLPGTLQESAL